MRLRVRVHAEAAEEDIVGLRLSECQGLIPRRGTAGPHDQLSRPSRNGFRHLRRTAVYVDSIGADPPGNARIPCQHHGDACLLSYRRHGPGELLE